MSPEKDYYAVLGILPDAEVVVVVAAYRALASLYHPDKWKGDVTEATRRMAEINVAYGVLGDAAKRKQYDASRKTSHSSFDAEDEQRDEAFDSALSELEERWQVAVRIFPDLTDIRKQLAKTAHRLAFAFVTVMLETKKFQDRHSLANFMENKFLERYFGTNKQVIAFAKELIQLGLKDAVIGLNQYVDVLGSEVHPDLVINKVLADYKVSESREAFSLARAKAVEREQELSKVEEHRQNLRKFRKVNDARYLAHLFGYGVDEVGAGLFVPLKYVVTRFSSNAPVVTLKSPEDFVNWVIFTLCK